MACYGTCGSRSVTRADPGSEYGGGAADGEREERIYNGGLGTKPQRCPGAEPLVRGSGPRGEAP